MSYAPSEVPLVEGVAKMRPNSCCQPRRRPLQKLVDPDFMDCYDEAGGDHYLWPTPQWKVNFGPMNSREFSVPPVNKDKAVITEVRNSVRHLGFSNEQG